MPGVLAVMITAGGPGGRRGSSRGGEASGGKNADGSAGAPKPRQMALAMDKVRYVGDPVAMRWWPRRRKQAKDAAEMVLLDVDVLPAVTTPAAAAADGAPVLHEEAPGNVAMDVRDHGDRRPVDAAFAKAAHVTTLKPT